MAGGGSGSGAASQQGTECTNARVRPPELVDYNPAMTSQTVAVYLNPRHLGAEDGLPTSDIKPDVTVPVQNITIKDKHLEDAYIEEMLQKKGLDESQITRIRSVMREYIDSFIKAKSVELDDSAYGVLTNMLIHLIEESSKE